MLDCIFDGRKGTDYSLIVRDLLVGVEGDIEVDLGQVSTGRTEKEYSMENRTRIKTRLSLRSTSVMASLFDKDMVTTVSCKDRFSIQG